MKTPEIGKFHSQITAVGSRVTCSPAPVGTDQDWLVKVPADQFTGFANSLLGSGWVVGGSMIPPAFNYLPQSEQFNSFTNGDDNVIATSSEEFHQRFLAATSLAKRYNLMRKYDRIELFQAILYGVSVTPAPEPAACHPFLTAKALEDVFA